MSKSRGIQSNTLDKSIKTALGKKNLSRVVLFNDPYQNMICTVSFSVSGDEI